eukprot:TRINITY_DN5073_c0_g1_i14.p1 TRINITY_DN5073_c0_g1~~TRINITY_DN5073_c0_g1_i14.p1  ORF type:complete len:274 (+),score=25.43 TRINITY_DN5073_c0_g1_i14:173-994(+)
MCCVTASLSRKVLGQLLDYAVCEPPPDADKSRSFKYPFYAVEVLSCNSIRKMFFAKSEREESKCEQELFEDAASIVKAEESHTVSERTSVESTDSSETDLLDKLFTVINTKNEINPVLAGYFEKIVESLLCEYKEELLKYVFSSKEHSSNLLYHCYNTSIANLLLSLLSANTSDTPEHPFHQHKPDIISQLVDNINPDNSEDVIANSCFVLTQLIASKSYLHYLSGENTIASIFNKGFMNENVSRASTKYLLAVTKVKLESAKDGSTESNTMT